MYKTVIKIIILCVVCSSSLKGQDMMSELNEIKAKDKEYTKATFKSTRLINFHTIETLGPRTLDFRITHHFSDFNTGSQNFWGLDGPASIRLGLEYSYNGRLQFGLGRTSYEKTLDGFAKYRLIRQTVDGKIPFSITLVSSLYYTLMSDITKNITGFDRYKNSVNRMSFCYQLLIGRKFSESLSFQITPIYIHYNLVETNKDKNDHFSISFLGRYKISKRTALIAEYNYQLNKFSSITTYNAAGVGIELETGGHVFQMFLTNSFGLLEPQVISKTLSSWGNCGFKLGFNISRAFTL